MALTRRAAVPLVVALALAACGTDQPTASSPSTVPPSSPPATTAPPAPSPSSTAEPVPDPDRVEVLFSGLQAPWGLTFLPDGDALVTERDTARVYRLPAGGGEPQLVTTVEQAQPGGEGGLLGIAASPSFADDGLVYVYATAAEDNRVLRFALDAPQQVQPVLTGIPRSRIHNGGRMRFGPDGMLYVGTGDAGDTSLSQDDGSLGGKVVRVDPATGEAEVHSKGHRNVQGLAFAGDQLYSVEFGQNRFDEVNALSEGTNGGWPQVEGPGDGGGRFLAPVTTWETSEASPSGADVAGGSLWVAALRGERLWQVPLDDPGSPVAHLQDEFGRLRHTERAPDGSLWVLTSNRDGRGDPVAEDDRVLRLPAS